MIRMKSHFFQGHRLLRIADKINFVMANDTRVVAFLKRMIVRSGLTYRYMGEDRKADQEQTLNVLYGHLQMYDSYREMAVRSAAKKRNAELNSIRNRQRAGIAVFILDGGNNAILRGTRIILFQ